MFIRTNAKVVFLLLVSTIWLSCEDYDDSPWGYDDDLYTRASVVGTYQAESRTFQKGCALMKNNSGYTGTGYMDYGGKLSLVEWNNVNVPSAGDYTLMFRYANGSSDDRRCSLTVNDASTGSVSFSPTGSWTKWKTVSFKARLKAGANKVRVTAISYGGPNLDKMDVVNDGSDDNGTSRCVGVAENKKAFLTCPAGEVIEGIEFASYGVPEGSCTTGFTRGTCHATSSLSKVKASCLSKRYCTVTANNSTFGDPCGGTFKKLAIEYTCTQGDTTGVVAKDFVGYFERTPVMNDWHKVNISLENNQLWWKNAAGRRWSLNYASGILETGSDCPYGVKVIEVEKQSGSDPVKALKFLGGRYNKKTIDNPGDQCPDDPNKTEPGECGCGVPEGSCDRCTNVLLKHEKLVAGEHICSENGKYEFGLSPQGELAIREGTKKLWSAGTFGSTVHLVMQGDGNLVVYNAIKPLWDSKTAKKPGATLKLENDGRVVIRLGGNELWSAGGVIQPGDGFTFFALGDSRTNQSVFRTIVSNIVKLDRNAIGIFNSGDLTTDGRSSNWDTHIRMIREGGNGRVRTDMTNFSSSGIRYIGAMGNHDDGTSSWFSNWNKYLPGQKNLGRNSKDGIYFSVRYQNAIFIVLDSVHGSSSQKSWLSSQLANASNVRWKFVFFHHPIYPCNGKSPYDRGAEDWVELFEKYNVDIVFVADSHTYERTCPMILGECDSDGVVYLNTSGAGAPTREVDKDKSDRAGDDRYDCSEILQASRGEWDHYCHFTVSDNQVVQKCYSHNTTSNPKFTWTLKK